MIEYILYTTTYVICSAIRMRTNSVCVNRSFYEKTIVHGKL